MPLRLLPLLRYAIAFSLMPYADCAYAITLRCFDILLPLLLRFYYRHIIFAYRCFRLRYYAMPLLIFRHCPPTLIFFIRYIIFRHFLIRYLLILRCHYYVILISAFRHRYFRHAFRRRHFRYCRLLICFRHAIVRCFFDDATLC